MEKIGSLKIGNFKKLCNLVVIASIFWTLSGCTSKQEQYERQLEKVHKLENKVNGLKSKLMEQSSNYEIVGTNENIQQDLKENGADSSIDQEIGYAHNRASEQDKDIAETKEELAEAQKKLTKANEKLATLKGELNTQNKRLTPGKYGYIKEEFEKSHNN